MLKNSHYLLVFLVMGLACAGSESPKGTAVKAGAGNEQSPSNSANQQGENPSPMNPANQVNPANPAIPANPANPANPVVMTPGGETPMTNPPMTNPPMTNPNPGNQTQKPPTTEFGELNEPLANNGYLSGYAGVKGIPDNILELKFYIDGDNKSGKLLGTTRANLVAYDNGLEGDHGFIFEAPKSALDAKPHKLSVYVIWGDAEYLLSAKKPSYDFRGFAQKGAANAPAFGKTNFVVNGRVNSNCSRCHSFSYEDRWVGLTEATQDGKWTAASNYLIAKLRRGHTQQRTGNANLCSYINCDEVENWWRQEFESN